MPLLFKGLMPLIHKDVMNPYEERAQQCVNMVKKKKSKCIIVSFLIDGGTCWFLEVIDTGKHRASRRDPEVSQTPPDPNIQPTAPQVSGVKCHTSLSILHASPPT